MVRLSEKKIDPTSPSDTGFSVKQSPASTNRAFESLTIGNPPDIGEERKKFVALKGVPPSFPGLIAVGNQEPLPNPAGSHPPSMQVDPGFGMPYQPLTEEQWQELQDMLEKWRHDHPPETPEPQIPEAPIPEAPIPNDPLTSGPTIQEQLKIVGDFLLESLKDIYESTGLKDLFEGLGGVLSAIGKGGKYSAEILKDLASVLSGKTSFSDFINGLKEKYPDISANAIDALKSSGQILLGAVKVLGEVTGISDIIRGIGAAIDGKPLSATWYLGWGVASLAAFVASFGGSAAIRPIASQIFKQIGKIIAGEGLEIGFKAGVKFLAERFVKALAVHSPKDIAKLLCDAAGEGAAKEFLELVEKKGIKAITAEDIEKLLETKGKEVVKKLIEKLLEREGGKKAIDLGDTALRALMKSM